MFDSYVYTFWSLTSSCEIIYSRIFINNCKNCKVSLLLFVVYSIVHVSESLSAFQIKCTPVSRNKSRIGDRFLPRLYSFMRFTEKQRCTTALSFFPLFSAWEYIYSASGVLETNACVPDLLFTILLVPSSYLFSLSFFQSFLSLTLAPNIL